MTARTTGIAALVGVAILGGAFVLVSNGIGTVRLPVQLDVAWDRAADAEIGVDGVDWAACVPMAAKNATKWHCTTTADPGDVVSLTAILGQEASCSIKTPGKTYRNSGIGGGHGCVVSGPVIP